MPTRDVISTTAPTLNDPPSMPGRPVVEIDVKAFVGSRALVQANSGGGKSRTLRRILEVTHGHVQHLVLDVEGEFYTLREKFDYMIAGAGGDCAATVKNAPRLVTMLLKTGASAILDISELANQDEFVAAVCEALVGAPRALWHPVMVVIDEAQRFCPQDEEASSTHAVIDLMTRGRKRGYNGVLACQRLSELHKTAAAECNNLLIGRTSLDVDISRARKALGMKARDAEETLPRLRPGEFFCVGPGLSETVQRVQVGHVVTTHPEAGSGMVPMAPARAVTKAMLAELADLDEQAAQEESELERLRRRVAELEGEVREAKGEISRPADEVIEAQRAYDRRLEEMQGERDALRREVALDASVIEESVNELDNITVDLNKLVERMIDVRNKYGERLQESVEREALATDDGERGRGQSAPHVHDMQQGAATPGQRASAAAGNVAEPHRAPNGHRSAGPSSSLSPMIRAFLTVLAQHGAGRHSRPLSKKQILLYTGYAASGPVSKAFAEIERARWWSKTAAGGYDITDEGMKALGSFEPLPRREKLRAKIASELGPMERKFFEVICAAYPRGISKKEILQATGYATSGPVSKAFAYIVGRDWAVSDGPARLIASKELFE